MLRLSSAVDSFSAAAKNILGESATKKHPERVQTVVDVLRENFDSMAEIGDLREDQIDEIAEALELKTAQAGRLKQLWRAEEIIYQPPRTTISAEARRPAAEKIVHERRPVEIVERSMELVPKEDREHDFFISHAQGTGQDQAMTLHAVLKDMGYKVWHDMSADKLTEIGMERGVRNAKCVLLFLSDGLMSRPFCNKELRWAELYGCTMIGVVELDERHGKADFAKEHACAPTDLEHLLNDIEFEPYQRRKHLQHAMLKKIVHDSNVMNSLEDDETDQIAVPPKLGEPSSANSSSSTISVSRRVSVKVDEWIAQQLETSELAESEDETEDDATFAVQRRRALSSFISELRTDEEDADPKQWHRSRLSSSSRQLSSNSLQPLDAAVERAVEEAQSGNPEMTSAVDGAVYDITFGLTADDPEDVFRAKTLLKSSVEGDLASPGSARSLA